MTTAVRPGPARAGRASLRRPALKVVHAPPTAGSPLAFAVGCVTLLGAGLIVLLLLNTAVAQGSFGLQTLQARAQQLADQRQALASSNALAAAPAQLSAKAWSLGLVPADGTAFLHLRSGRVLGVANPAPRATPPVVAVGAAKGAQGASGAGGGAVADVRPSGSGAEPQSPPAARVDLRAGTGAAPPPAPRSQVTPKGTKSSTGTTKTKTKTKTTTTTTTGR